MFREVLALIYTSRLGIIQHFSIEHSHTDNINGKPTGLDFKLSLQLQIDINILSLTLLLYSGSTF